jgi:uncharacterized protein (DUF2147 family)
MRASLIVLLFLASGGSATAQSPEGVWLVEHKAAVRLFKCGDALCGSVAWLRKPALRTAEMCNRTIIWSLQATGDGRWNNGWFYDPENSTTYHINLTQISPDEISAHVYPAISWLGETVNLIRIAPFSLNGWCN